MNTPRGGRSIKLNSNSGGQMLHSQRAYEKAWKDEWLWRSLEIIGNSETLSLLSVCIAA